MPDQCKVVRFIASLTGFRPLVTMSWGSDMLVDSQKNLIYEMGNKIHPQSIFFIAG